MQMNPTVEQHHRNCHYYELPLPREDLASEVIEGLRRPQKVISPKFFYDQRGSELFDRITQLPEYYQTRTELNILQQHASDIAKVLTPETSLIEYGSGNSEKLRALLDIVVPATYVPVEISRSHLQKYAQALATDYREMDVHAVRADYSQAWELPVALNGSPRLAYFAGSSLGNFTPEQSVEFLQLVRSHVGPEGGLLIGIDKEKDHNILQRAYNDSEGITAAFNLNCLEHLNKLLGCDFNTEYFHHHAFYNTEEHRIEMHLKTQRCHDVHIAGETIPFEHGETIHTENSYKYSDQSFAALAEKAGFQIMDCWQDENALFAVYYLRQVAPVQVINTLA